MPACQQTIGLPDLFKNTLGLFIQCLRPERFPSLMIVFEAGRKGRPCGQVVSDNRAGPAKIVVRCRNLQRPLFDTVEPAESIVVVKRIEPGAAVFFKFCTLERAPLQGGLIAGFPGFALVVDPCFDLQTVEHVVIV